MTTDAARPVYTETKAFAKARKVLDGLRIEPAEALPLVKELRNELAYAAAREIAHIYRMKPNVAPDLAFELLRVEVTSTYKDPEVATEKGLDDAWQALVAAGWDPNRLLPTTDAGYLRRAREVYGLAGAITRRRWEYDSRVEHLHESLRYYTKGYGGIVATDSGYQAINAAYLLDLLASLERKEEDEPESATSMERRETAARIRDELTKTLPRNDDDWWTTASLGEAYFGLGEHDKAIEVLRAGRTLPPEATRPDGWKPPPDWEIESTSRQLASLARIQCRARGEREPVRDSVHWKTLEAGLGLELSGVRSAFVGKIGLALSGGGFRASLYHIGVLARLAELDLLRYVEVLSCVSGGSIIGAHYYLELRHLLQTKRNDQITQDHYLELVARVERDFLAGVQTNLRMQLAAETATAWANAWQASFSQTRRLGELFEARLFAKVQDGTPKDEKRWLNELSIEPLRIPDPARDPARAFSPRSENWRLSAKVPILILNATTLNTGHPWQFTAAHMGEPAGGIDTHVDANARLRRVRFHKGPDGYREFRLGWAVAASAAVPGLFDPLPLANLYEKPMLVRLADGGVYDNQGISGLLEQGCTFLIVSDASGQSPVAVNPSGHRIGVAVTANDILMSRVRGLQFDVITKRLAARTLRGLAFVHLMQDLDGGAINQKGSQTPGTPATASALTSYGIRRDIQEMLARIRTDLDAFSDFEAYALMASGYHAIRQQFTQQTLQQVLGTTVKAGTWAFTRVIGYIDNTTRPPLEYASLCALLGNGRLVLHKVDDLYPRRPWRRVLGRLIVVGGLLAAAIVFAPVVMAVLGAAALVVVIGLGAYTLVKPLLPQPKTDDVRPRKAWFQRVFAAGGVGVSLVAGHQLRRDTRRYLDFGALDNERFLARSRERWPRG